MVVYGILNIYKRLTNYAVIVFTNSKEEMARKWRNVINNLLRVI